MKKIFFAVLAALVFSYSASAIVASKKPITYTQPDGSVITITLQGDEYEHWAVTPDGTKLYPHPDGFYRTSPVQVPSMVVPSMRTRNNSAVGNTSLALGEHKFLVILVEFKDVKFTLSNPKQAFENLLNERGYSQNGATGSCFDFYYEQSNGQFIPSYDVYGPATLSKNVSAYGGNDYYGNDKDPDGAFAEACTILDDEIDFSEYDQDHDGYVDNIFFYYAGYNEAEGGASNTIWPHQWSLEYYHGNEKHDGVRLSSYACSSEYKGSSGKRMCGIGTFSHEFGHVLGLPDFYDTDYSSNGQAYPLEDYSTMDSGSYNNEGRTPPYFSALERYMLGWMNEPEELVYTGNYSMLPIRNDKAYRLETTNPGEYFYFECRDNEGWDRYLPGSGMIVYHVDQSNNRVSGNYTANYLWEYTNSINAYSSHPCYRIIRAKDSGALNYWPFPGAGKVYTYKPKIWNGTVLDNEFSSISFDGESVSFRFKGDDSDVLAASGISYILYNGPSDYELIPGNDLVVKTLEWKTENNTLIAEVSYTNGTKEVIELEL